MDLLVNENIPNSVVQSLRTRGHDVLAVKEVLRGADDPTVLARAQAERRLVITQDKDFGELAFRSSLPAECGIILFRLSGDDPGADINRMIDVIESRDAWQGLFAVATDDRVRVRSLPGSP
jgi:predicted nuclease of predicted toxin-antitoxin system